MTKRNCRYESSFNDGVLEFRLFGEIDHHSAVNIRTEIDEEICRLRPHKTVLENMTLAPIKLLKKSKEEAESAAMELLEKAVSVIKEASKGE